MSDYNIDYEISDEVSLKIKEKLPLEHIKLLNKYLREENFDDFVNLISTFDLNYKSINQVKQVMSKISPSKAYIWANDLISQDGEDVTKRIAAGLLFIRSEIWNRDQTRAIEIIDQFSKCEEWKIRGIGINLFANCMIKSFDDFFDTFKLFIASDSSKFRRVAISTAQQIATYKGKINFLTKEFLDTLKPYLNEEDAYVNSVSNETFGSFIKNYPDIFYSWISEKVIEVGDDPKGKASILYMLSNVHATNHFKKSCEIIDMLINDTNIRVKRARSAALRNLAKYHSKDVNAWLESRMNLPQAVDHWSELQIDGLLDSFI